MTEPRVGDWRMHALAAAVCAFAAVADVAVGYPWIALIPALAAGSCSMTAVGCWYRRKSFGYGYRCRPTIDKTSCHG
jgi:hypothetical protein